jgi:hypothetical protein
MIRTLAKKIYYTIKTTVLTVQSFILIILFSRWKNVFTKKNKTGGKRPCLVIGNGPSLLNDINEIFKKRDNWDIMCVNDFVLSEHYETIKPEYYILFDPFYWIELNVMEEKREQILNDLINKTDWKLELYIPFEAKKNKRYFGEHGIFKGTNISLRFFNRTYVDGARKFKYLLFDKNLGIPWSQNVLVAALYLSIFLNYKKVFVVGADHSWHEDLIFRSDNSVTVYQKHFYDIDKSDSERVEIHKISKNLESDYKIHELFFAWAKMFEGYWEIRKYAEHKNCQIINLSSKSYIDAFPRMDFIKMTIE